MKAIAGSIVALVTPMHEDGSLDREGLGRLIDWHIEQGTQCIGIVGTTGESPTTSDAEKSQLLAAVVEAVGDRAKVIAGVGTFDTVHTIHLADQAAKGVLAQSIARPPPVQPSRMRP